ncbi:MAG TPA: (2Fe-2S) ferredoxin domain-containing protein [Polyangia bacterium]|nr:(2Fe-2S) ferredoxin domain-containing protein [Polyangia bacterium]
MSVPASRFKYHVFICQTQRPPMAKPSCGPRGAAEIVQAMQEQLAAHPELWGSVMITPSGCLGPCFDGPSMVVYPEAVWYCGLKVADVKAIVDEHLVGGKPVERLIYKWPT